MQFLSSATKVIRNDGEILVTLCKGQGGTPADVPVRRWSDTWQVVAMATYADLVLHEVVPFQAEALPKYDSTGFRYILPHIQVYTMHTEGMDTGTLYI